MTTTPTPEDFEETRAMAELVKGEDGTHRGIAARCYLALAVRLEAAERKVAELEAERARPFRGAPTVTEDPEEDNVEPIL